MTKKFHGEPCTGRSRAGFTLIEILCVMMLLTLLLGIMGMMLRQTLEIERSQARNLDHVMQVNALADQFRTDVAQAESAPATWQAYTADNETLILQMKNSAHVLYLWRAGKLHRRVIENEKSREQILPLERRGASVEFVRERPESKLLRLRTHIAKDGKTLPGQSLEFAAAVGGDWR